MTFIHFVERLFVPGLLPTVPNGGKWDGERDNAELSSFYRFRASGFDVIEGANDSLTIYGQLTAR